MRPAGVANTQVLRALMHLKGIDAATLARISGCDPDKLIFWLNMNRPSESTRGQILDGRTQQEIITLLGVHGDLPRMDIIHQWRVREPFAKGRDTLYNPLQRVLDAFGDAVIYHLDSNEKAALTLAAEFRFGLRFATFSAVLTIEGHPLRDLCFDPERLRGLRWGQVKSIALPSKHYNQLQPGKMRPDLLAHILNKQLQRTKLTALLNEALEVGDEAEAQRLEALLTQSPRAAIQPPAVAVEEVKG